MAVEEMKSSEIKRKGLVDLSMEVRDKAVALRIRLYERFHEGPTQLQSEAKPTPVRLSLPQIEENLLETLSAVEGATKCLEADVIAHL